MDIGTPSISTQHNRYSVMGVLHGIQALNIKDSGITNGTTRYTCASSHMPWQAAAVLISTKTQNTPLLHYIRMHAWPPQLPSVITC